MRGQRDQQQQSQAEAVGQRDDQNNMGFAGGEAAKKIAGAPEDRRRQPQADKAQARVLRLPRSSREVGCRRVVPFLGDDIQIGPQDADVEGADTFRRVTAA